ncbi:hypothetical protein L3X38_003129 [Prunus dulcis]|uniref:Protein ALP1-like n=1 Tax=Prunus dulcis TaxID=3755 RepID=A0AAD4WV97_PRUDU|nr:hypothetical protein L3X38_003129 [Prunus dulcis]
MEDFRRCLERQKQETNERNCRAYEINELQKQVNEQIVIAVDLQDEENQGRRRGSQVGRRRNVDRHRHSRVMHDICNYDAYFVKKCDATELLGLLQEKKLTAVIRMLTYGASADQVDEIAQMGKFTTLEALVRFCQAVETLYTRNYLRRPTLRDLQRLLQKAEAREFSGMIGSIACMHWQWKNCQTAWQGDYRNRKGQKSIILEAVAGFDTWVWHAFFGVARSQNDLNVLGQSPVFNDVLRGQDPNITYQVNNTVYQTGYYLADGIYPRWTTFVKSIPNSRSQKQKLFVTYQERYMKDVERCFGILQALWLIVRDAAQLGKWRDALAKAMDNYRSGENRTNESCRNPMPCTNFWNVYVGNNLVKRSARIVGVSVAEGRAHVLRM